METKKNSASKSSPKKGSKKSNSNIKTLHALIIGIDNYPNPAHRLRGCKNDASAFAGYLSDYSKANGLAYNEKRLFDDAASRQEIIDGFGHFSTFKKGDICVLYYSGHGSQMAAPPEFWDEQDHRSETIVCYDSRSPGGRDLIDKELATLIWLTTKDHDDMHFLAVMDCCHSGSNTRDLDIRARMAEPSTVVLRDASGYFGKEHWKDYQPPSARHIHLSAAKDSETAKELSIQGTQRGAFTFNLIKTLEQVGINLSYEELVAHVGQRVRNLVKEQTPLCNAYKVPTDVGLTFLGSAMKKGEFLVSYDNKEGWIVNIGGVQGVPRSGATLKLETGDEISIKDVKANFSVVTSTNKMSTDAQYKAVLTRIAERNVDMPRIRIAFSKDSEKAGVDTLKAIFNKKPSNIIDIVSNENDTDYVVRAWDKAYRLTKMGDTVPRFRRVPGYTEASAQTFIENIETVASWKTKLLLENPLTTIKDDEFEIIVQNAAGNALKAPFILQQPEETKEVVAQFGITNRSYRPYWVSALYLGSDFGVTNEFLPKKEIKPGETAWVEFENDRSIPFMVQKEYLSWGVNEISEYFKFFISTDPINTSIHNQDPLELDMKAGATRAIQRSAPPIPIHDWRTILVPLKIVCPLAVQPVASNSKIQLKRATIEIETPAGFSAEVTFSTTEQATRSLGDVPILRGGGDMFSVPLVEGMGDAPMLDVLELVNIKGDVSYEKPLKINIKDVNNQQTIVPFGFDAETGMYVPVGISDDSGTVHIHQLPPADKTESTRSLLGTFGKSIKIYFKKIIQPLTGYYKYPMLRKVAFVDSTEDFIYEEDVNAIKDAVSKAQSIVLFVHGLIGSTSDHPKAIRRATGMPGLMKSPESYDLVLAFDYETLNTKIDITAADLEKALKNIGITEGVGKRFEIVAHSMGGLVTRYFVEKLSGKKFVSKVMLFGTPNNGSELSDLRIMVTNMLTVAVNGAIFLKPYILPLSFLGKALNKILVTVDQLNPKSDFIKELNSQPDTGIHYYLVAGNTDLIKKEEHPETYYFYQNIIHALQNTGTHKAADWWFKEPNDLAVKVISAHFVGNQKNVHIDDVPCDHFNFFSTQSKGVEIFAQVISAP